MFFLVRKKIWQEHVLIRTDALCTSTVTALLFCLSSCLGICERNPYGVLKQLQHHASMIYVYFLLSPEVLDDFTSRINHLNHDKTVFSVCGYDHTNKQSGMRNSCPWRFRIHVHKPNPERSIWHPNPFYLFRWVLTPFALRSKTDQQRAVQHSKVDRALSQVLCM